MGLLKTMHFPFSPFRTNLTLFARTRRTNAVHRNSFAFPVQATSGYKNSTLLVDSHTRWPESRLWTLPCTRVLKENMSPQFKISLRTHNMSSSDRLRYQDIVPLLHEISNTKRKIYMCFCCKMSLRAADVSGNDCGFGEE